MSSYYPYYRYRSWRVAEPISLTTIWYLYHCEVILYVFGSNHAWKYLNNHKILESELSLYQWFLLKQQVVNSHNNDYIMKLNKTFL